MKCVGQLWESADAGFSLLLRQVKELGDEARPTRMDNSVKEVRRRLAGAADPADLDDLAGLER